MKRYWGVDLHRLQFTVCLWEGEEKKSFRQWKIEQLPEFVAQLGCRTSWRWKRQAQPRASMKLW